MPFQELVTCEVRVEVRNGDTITGLALAFANECLVVATDVENQPVGNVVIPRSEIDYVKITAMPPA